MASVAYALCIVLCICSLQNAVQACALILVTSEPRSVASSPPHDSDPSKKEKLALTVYLNEIRGGPNITILAAAGTGQGNFSALGWGSLLVSENILKEGPSPDSPTLGRATGSGLLSTKGGFADGGTQVINKFWFSPTSKYLGSSITVLGTLAYPLAPWELTAIAGTGQFRGYYGYVLVSPELSYTVAPLFVYKFEFHLYKLY